MALPLAVAAEASYQLHFLFEVAVELAVGAAAERQGDLGKEVFRSPAVGLEEEEAGYQSQVFRLEWDLWEVDQETAGADLDRMP